MAEKELAILLRAKGATQAARDIGKVDSAVGKLGRTASQGLRTAGANIAKIGLVAAAGVGLAVKGGISSLAELEDATSSVDGAIKQMGLTGQVTSAQVAAWANEIEANVQAAFDDKEIVQATATLLRFGKVTPANLQPAMVVLTDLAAKTGDVESAATLMGKALADPAKAAGKLSRYGIILTKVEQDQIKAFTKAGDAAGAQKVLLDALAKTTAGAAAASKGPYRDALNILTDVTEDAQRALGMGFLPVLEKVAKLLGSELAKPSTIAGIKAFGQGLAGGLDSLITLARGLPWATIGDSLHLAGMGAKLVFDAFMSMPPWVQTAVLTGWGLNKLTGGALGSIVGQLASGLIKGVLGMNAGVVNINAGIVRGGGGVPGVVPSGGGGVGGALKTAAKIVLPIAIGAAVLEAAAEFRRGNPERGKAGMVRPVGGTWSAAGRTPTGPTSGGMSPEERDAARTLQRIVSAGNQETARLRNALATLPTPIVNIVVNTNVTANAVSKAQRQTFRVGNSSRVTAS